MKTLLAPWVVCFAAALSAGCATTEYRPEVDTGVSLGNYEADVYDCQRIAGQHPPEDAAAGGAVTGAILGALVGAAFGLRGNNIARIAAVGAVNGGVNGAVIGVAEQRAMVARCMAGRGYNVVAP